MLRVIGLRVLVLIMCAAVFCGAALLWRVVSPFPSVLQHTVGVSAVYVGSMVCWLIMWSAGEKLAIKDPTVGAKQGKTTWKMSRYGYAMAVGVAGMATTLWFVVGRGPVAELPNLVAIATVVMVIMNVDWKLEGRLAKAHAAQNPKDTDPSSIEAA